MKRIVPGVVAIALSAGWANAQQITDIGFDKGFTASSVAGLSSDGSVVTGSMESPQGQRPFTWTAAGGRVNLGTFMGFFGLYALDISDDGRVVVGATFFSGGSGQVALRWTSETGYEDLGLLVPSDDPAAIAAGTSADGSVVVGTSFATGSILAFRWTADQGMMSLGPPPTGVQTRAVGVSSDGSVVVGEYKLPRFPGPNRAFRWTQDGGYETIGLMPQAGTAEATEISPNGRVVVGTAGTTAGTRAFRWTTGDTIMSDMGILPGFEHAAPGGVSRDGSIVTGTCTASGVTGRAFMWTVDFGLVDLQDYLQSHGVDTTGWSLMGAHVSADGSTVAGVGVHNGARHAWIASLPCWASAQVTTQPHDTIACAAGVATISAAAAPAPRLSYRWERDGKPLSDDGHFTGTATPALMIHDTSTLDAGEYRLAITSICDTVRTDAAVLSVCPSDFNCDGTITSQDFFDFLGAFFKGAPAGDINRDASVDSQDFFDFLGAFFGGC
jgi:probable HAF family extracellular repeat protein